MQELSDRPSRLETPYTHLVSMAAHYVLTHQGYTMPDDARVVPAGVRGGSGTSGTMVGVAPIVDEDGVQHEWGARMHMDVAVTAITVTVGESRYTSRLVWACIEGEPDAAD